MIKTISQDRRTFEAPRERTVPNEEERMADAFSNMTPQIKLSFVSNAAEDAVFGRGVAALCRGVREHGSLNKAAKNMSMAYSKAWRIMKTTEEAFGVQLLERDGAHGSTLTPEGQRLLDAYDEVQRRTSVYAADALKELMAK